jgi:hypothetical protein
LPGSYGKINIWDNGAGFTARTKFRDFDGVVRPVKRNGSTKAAAERNLKAALVDRQAPVKEHEITPDSKFGQAADRWFVELEQAVESGDRSPGTLDTYRSVYSTHVNRALLRCDCVRSRLRLRIGRFRQSRRSPSAPPGRPRS